MQQLEFEPGQIIFSEGDPSHLTYRILAGSVDIAVQDHDGGERKIASLGKDEIFGEMGIIDDSPRSASAIAREPTTCQVYSADEVLSLLSSNSDEAIDMIRSLITRLRAVNRKLASTGEPEAIGPV